MAGALDLLGVKTLLVRDFCVLAQTDFNKAIRYWWADAQAERWAQLSVL